MAVHQGCCSLSIYQAELWFRSLAFLSLIDASMVITSFSSYVEFGGRVILCFPRLLPRLGQALASPRLLSFTCIGLPPATTNPVQGTSTGSSVAASCSPLAFKAETVIQPRNADLAVQIDPLGCFLVIAVHRLSRCEIPYACDASFRRILIGALDVALAY